MNKNPCITLGTKQYDIEELLSEVDSRLPAQHCCDDCIVNELAAYVTILSDTEEQKELAFQRLLGGLIIHRRMRNRLQGSEKGQQYGT
jgi:hypothetical protein